MTLDMLFRLLSYVLFHFGPDRRNKLNTEREVCSGAYSVFMKVLLELIFLPMLNLQKKMCT